MTQTPHHLTRRSNMPRRQLLQAGGLGMLGLTLPELLAARAGELPVVGKPVSSFGRAKRCIFLFMWGGPSQLETWDMKPDAPAEIRGEFKPISTKVPGIQICEHFPQLAQRTDQLAIVRSVTHNNVNHTAATHFLLTGQTPPLQKDRRLQSPHIGSVLARLGRGKGPLPPFVSMRPKLENTVPRFVEESQGQFAGWLGAVHDPLTIDHDPSRDDYRVGALELPPDMPPARLAERRALLAQLEQQRPFAAAGLAVKEANYQRAYELLSSVKAGRGAFDLRQETNAVRDRYGRNPHGQSVLQARRLIEHGVPLVTIYWPNDGIKNVSVYWDTHRRNFIDHKDRLMPPADQAFSALLDDLSERGLLEETLVIWSGEFGRTPKVGQRNSDAGAGADGRDHWPGCFTSVLAGGGIRDGVVHGRSDRHAAYPAADPVAPEDLIATVYHALGVPRQLALPDTQNRPHFIRPRPVIESLFG